MKILADASLPGLEQAFPKPFCITYYHHLEGIADLLPGQDVLLCRSTLKVNQSLFGTSHIPYVATASSGTDHLDVQWLTSQNTQVIDGKPKDSKYLVQKYITNFYGEFVSRLLV